MTDVTKPERSGGPMGAWRYGALALVLLVGVAIRLFLLVRWPRRLNGDEATAGLMGLHILRGEFPVFMYSVAYQGTVESFLTAVVYTLLGATPLTVKVAVFLFSCLLVVLAFLLGRRMAGWPGGLASALLTAVAPPFLPLYGNYPMLGYMEVVVIGSAVLLLALDAVTDQAGGTRRDRKLLLLGLVAGVGWWVNPMILSYLGAAGLLLLFHARIWFPRGLWAVPLAFLVGSLPYWLFNLRHAFWSFVLFRKGVQGDVPERVQKMWEPVLEIAGVRGVLTDPVPHLSPAAGVVYLALLGVLLVELARRPAEPGALVRRRGIQLLLLFSLIQLAAFSTSAYPVIQRYLFPLYSSLPVLTAMALLGLWRWSRPLAVAALGVLLLNNALALGKTVRVFDAGLRNDWWRPEPVVALLEAEGIDRAYAELQVAPRLTFETRERIVVAEPLNERYPPFRERVDASPKVAYILARAPGVRIAADQLGSALDAAGARYQRQDHGAFSVFYDFAPPHAGSLASLPPRGWRAASEPAGRHPTRAFDRDADTAWLSGAPMQPGMWFRLDLGDVQPVAGVTVLPVRYRFGAPRGYRIEVSRDGAAWATVVSVPEFAFALRWAHGQPRLDPTGRIVVRFAPRPVRFIRITQTGEQLREWWGIAELFVYTPGAAREPPAATARFAQAGELEQAGRLAAAAAAYEQVVVLDPEREEAHWRLLEVYQKAGVPVEGSDPLRRARLFESLGVWARAARQYEELLEGPPEERQHTDVLVRLAEAYRRQGAADRAAEVERRLAAEFTPPTRAEARFGDAVRLLGYGLTPREPRAGGTVELAYYWQALKPTSEDLAVFVHFVLDGKVRFQHDHEPLDGRYPTSRWAEGERIRESYGVRLPPDLPPGEYEVRIGLWNPRSGKRLRVSETTLPRVGDQVRVATLRLRASR